MEVKGIRRLYSEHLLNLKNKVDIAQSDVRPNRDLTLKEQIRNTWYNMRAKGIYQRYEKRIINPMMDAKEEFPAIQRNIRENPELSIKKKEQMILKAAEKRDAKLYYLGVGGKKPDNVFKKMWNHVKGLWTDRQLLLDEGKLRFKRTINKGKDIGVHAMKRTAIAGRKVIIRGAMSKENIKGYFARGKEKRQKFWQEIKEEAAQEMMDKTESKGKEAIENGDTARAEKMAQRKAKLDGFVGRVSIDNVAQKNEDQSGQETAKMKAEYVENSLSGKEEGR